MGKSRALKVALLEPFWGGSHRASAEGWASSSAHSVSVEHLPARFWKWRMGGAAFEFARRLRSRVENARADLVFATSLLDLAHLLAFLPKRVPSILYFHENQVAYPPRPDETVPERDLQYAFTNLASALAADRIAFNSVFQRDLFMQGMGELIRRMPDARPLWALEEVKAKSEVVPLGVSLSDIPQREESDGNPPVVLWNHRWEYDKAPEVFFRVLFRLADRGVPFRLAVAGESFGRVPDVFPEARGRLGSRLVHWGYLQERKAYAALLARADVVVSTALQENFGLSMIEGAYAGAHPLAPYRLSYPEVFPAEIHDACLYYGEQDLEDRLERLLTGRTRRLNPEALCRLLWAHRWEERATILDQMVSQVFESAKLCYK